MSDARQLACRKHKKNTTKKTNIHIYTNININAWEKGLQLRDLGYFSGTKEGGGGGTEGMSVRSLCNCGRTKRTVSEWVMGSMDSEWSIFDFIRQAPLMQVLPRPLKSKSSSVMSRTKLEAADVFCFFLPLEHIRMSTYVDGEVQHPLLTSLTNLTFD